MFVVEGRDLKRFAAALDGMDTTVKRDLSKRIRGVAEPIAREVRLAALELPAGIKNRRYRLNTKRIAAGERMGLRRGLAASVEVRQRHNAKNPGVRIVVSRSMFEKQTGKSRSLPRYVEGLRRKQWRHPVFADKGKTRGSWDGAWATQRSRPFLLPTVLPHKNEVRKAILEQFETTFDAKMAKHGIPIR